MGRIARVLVAGAWLLAGPALAYEQNDLIWRVGFTSIKADAGDSDATAVTPAGSEVVDLSTDTRLGGNVSYLLLDRFGLGLHSQWRSAQSLYLDDGSGARRGVRTRVQPLALTLQYFPPKLGQAQLRLGAGWQILDFQHERLRGALATDAGHVRLHSTGGLALELGLDWDLGRRTGLALSALHAEADSRMVLKQGGARVDRVDFSVDPLIWTLGLQRRF